MSSPERPLNQIPCNSTRFSSGFFYYKIKILYIKKKMNPNRRGQILKKVIYLNQIMKISSGRTKSYKGNWILVHRNIQTP